MLAILFKQVYAFEANPEIYEIVKLNIKNNKFNNVILSNKGVDNSNDILKLNIMIFYKELYHLGKLILYIVIPEIIWK